MSIKKVLSTIRYDLPASMVVFFVALPLCLGIALASGAPLFAGIIAGIVGGIVVGICSGSQLGVSGPAAGLAVIVLNAIGLLNGWEAFLVAVVLAGIIQLIMGYLRLGIIAYYFPTSVIKGMLTGIGLIIILKQIPHALGYDIDFEGDVAFRLGDENSFTLIHNALGSDNTGSTDRVYSIHRDFSDLGKCAFEKAQDIHLDTRTICCCDRGHYFNVSF